MNQLPQIIAHRGASQIAPENTLPAFELAYRLGAECIETDIHLTKDQIPILIHDPFLERTTDGKGLVQDFTFAELKKLDAGRWFSTKYAKTRLISLDQFLQWIKPKQMMLNLELKNVKFSYPHLEELVYDHIEYYQLEERTIISTFNPDSIKHMASFKKNISLALLRSRKHRHLCTYATDLGAQALHIHYRLLNRSLIEQCKQRQIKVRIYTVNQYKQIARCFHFGCHGIITDTPGKALYYRKGFTLENLF